MRERRLLTRDALTNVPLMMGATIVLGLFLVVLFGPLWAPENPYLTGHRTLSYVDGELVTPPFPPSEQFPLGTNEWGKDTLSLLLYGARNTLVACTFITMARLMVGSLLGALAGWNEGGLMDRTIMGAVGLTTALPTLITSMILIYALDIRRGLPVFIVGLSLVGWGEIVQYIRSEFMVLKTRPFVEGARAMGLRGASIAVRHILPNILPQLVVITLLEMGAVLMILGELGFVGVFIGGGTRTTTAADAAITIPDIPEWGAMMADARRWARAKPGMVFYPALAFFFAVVGFNSLGEGLRRLIERAGISTAFLLRKRMILIIAAITAATVFIVNNVGPAPSYARLAQQFNADQAYAYVETLTGMSGRGNGQAGGKIVFCQAESDPQEDQARNALEHGAAGLLLLTDADERPMDFLSPYRGAWVPAPIPVLRVARQVGDSLLADSGLTLDDLTVRFASQPLATRAHVKVMLYVDEHAQGRNVLGVLPGRNAAYAQDVLVVGGHYDHMGRDPDGLGWPGPARTTTHLAPPRCWRSPGTGRSRGMSRSGRCYSPPGMPRSLD